jgi:SAM-dependent methyltransferase
VELEYIKCDLCGINEFKLLLKTRDYRFGRKKKYSVVKCNKCGLIYLNPRPTKKILYSQYKKNYSPGDRNSLKTFLKNKSYWKEKLRPYWYRYIGFYSVFDLNEKGTFLDIGCASGDTLEFARKKGLDVYGVELNPRFVQICKDKKLNVYCGFVEDVIFPANMFDVIWMSQVLEHLPSPKSTLKEMKRILKPEGKIYIFCPNARSYLLKIFGKYWNGWFVPYHLYTFTEETIRLLAVRSGIYLESFSTSTPINHFIVSLKSYICGRTKDQKMLLDKCQFLDTFLFKAICSLLFRVLDYVFAERGDCIKAKLKK